MHRPLAGRNLKTNVNAKRTLVVALSHGRAAESGAMPLTITHHVDASRFEGVPTGPPAQARAICSYRRLGDVVVLHHTEVPRELQGQGVAAELVQVVLEWARTEGLRVRPTCSYVATYMRRHPETLDLLEHPPTKPPGT